MRILHLLHNGPFRKKTNELGGTEKIVQKLIQDNPDIESWSLTPEASSLVLTSHNRNQEYRFNNTTEALTKILNKKFFELIHIHHTYGFFSWSLNTALQSSGPYVFSFNDYYSICEGLFLRSHDGNVCNGKLCQEKCKSGEASLKDHRTAYFEILKGAQKLIHFSDSTREIVQGLYPSLRQWELIPHGLTKDVARKHKTFDQKTTERDELSLIALGPLAPHKGQELIEKLQEVSQLPSGRRLNIQILENYSDGQIIESIQKLNPHFVLLLSLCQETYSLSLDEARAAGYPVAVSPYGALKERVLKEGGGFVFSSVEIPTLLRELDENSQAQRYFEIGESLKTFKAKSFENANLNYRVLYLSFSSPKESSDVQSYLKGLPQDKMGESHVLLALDSWAIQHLGLYPRLRSKIKLLLPRFLKTRLRDLLGR